MALWEWRQQSRDRLWLVPFVAAPALLVGLQALAAYLGDGSVTLGSAGAVAAPPGRTPSVVLPSPYLLLALGWLGAFMAVPLGADALAGERERGQWAHSLTLPLSRRAWLGGKAASLLPGPLLAALTGQGLACLSAGGRLDPAFASPGFWARLLVWDASLAAFLAALALAFSARAGSARGANQAAGLAGLLLFPFWAALGSWALHAWAAAGVSAALSALAATFSLTLARRSLSA